MAKHPPPTRNPQFVMDINGGKKVCNNISSPYNKTVTRNQQETPATVTEENYWHHEWRMNKKRKAYTWYTHQSECQEGTLKECSYEGCPKQLRLFDRKGLPRSPQLYGSRYKCLQCSVINKKDTYYCNQVPRGVQIKKPSRCHFLYHEKYHRTIETTTDDTDDDTDDDN